MASESLIASTATVTLPIWVIAFNSGPLQKEVFRPAVPPWVKEPNNGAAFLIDPSHVRTFEAIAMNTGQGQIFKLSFAAVLLSNDVVYLKGCRMEA